MEPQNQTQNNNQPVPLKPKNSPVQNTQSAPAKKAVNPQKRARMIFNVMGIIIIALVVSNAIFIRKLYVVQNPSAVAENELKNLLVEVGKVVDLPKGETPTYATVSDPEKLRDQKFFANAMAGDKVLVYRTSGKAILWRPSTKKVVEISTTVSQVVDNNNASINR